MKDYKILIAMIALCSLFSTGPSFAMEEQDSRRESLSTVSNLLLYLYIKSFSEVSLIQEDGVFLIDLDTTILHSDRRIRIDNTKADLYEKHKTFIEMFKDLDLDAYQKLQDAGQGFAKRTEENIPEILEALSRQNVILIPFTNRSSWGAAHTETKLSELGYDFKRWNQGKTALSGTEYGDAVLVNDILYAKPEVENPNKGLGVKAVTDELKGKGVIKAFGFVDDRKLNTDAVESAMATGDLPGRIYHYTPPKRPIEKVETIKEIYRFTLGPKFQEYEDLFDQHFK